LNPAQPSKISNPIFWNTEQRIFFHFSSIVILPVCTNNFSNQLDRFAMIDRGFLLSPEGIPLASDREASLSENRHAWIQVVKGEIALNGTTLIAGDGAAISDEEKLAIEAKTDTEFLLFDLA
jgi:Quercetinase C-terminal cupin domain